MTTVGTILVKASSTGAWTACVDENSDEFFRRILFLVANMSSKTLCSDRIQQGCQKKHVELSSL